jgi:DNA (cytosine-5)-methyltransferase 1
MRGREGGQQLEVNCSGNVNSLTTATKDNLVLEVKKMNVKIRQATRNGFIDLELPGLANLSYESSQTRRGRVIEGGQISPTITTEDIPSLLELGKEEFYNFLYEIEGEIYLIRVRKLTPKECWRLMGFTDEDFNKAAEVNSNTQLYKEAGNSIVKQCLMAIFKNMGIGREGEE